MSDPLGGDVGHKGGNGRPILVDGQWASWCHRRAIKLFSEKPSSKVSVATWRWFDACERARAEWRLAKWLAAVFCVE